MRVDDRIRESVIYLNTSVGGGSGFLISCPSPMKGQRFKYAVTNWHVAVEDKADAIILNTLFGQKEHLQIDPEKWIHTEEDDLAIRQIALEEDLHRFATIPTEIFINDTIIADYDIGVGDWVYLVGRFHVHEGVSRILPTTRFGNIAMMSEEPIKIPTSRRSDGKQDCFLVEMRSIGGFSGSPAILKLNPAMYERPNWEVLRKALREKEATITSGPWLLGVDVGHLTQNTEILDEKDEPTGYHFVSNSAMTGIIPAWKLLDLLNSPEAQKDRADTVKKRRDDRDSASDEGFVADLLEKSDLSPTLRETIRRKLEGGEHEGVDEHVFKGALDRAIFPEKPDQES